MGASTCIIVLRWGYECDKKFIPIGYRYEDGDEDKDENLF